MNEMQNRFRGFYPIVIDIETAGFDPKYNAILEIALVSLKFVDENLEIDEKLELQIEPFQGSILCENALKFTGIRPFCKLRDTITEKNALNEIRSFTKRNKRKANCQKAVLVGHNINFDASFINYCQMRNNIKLNSFHAFTTFDTATLSAFACGQTVLAKACKEFKIDFDIKQAHNALYDAVKTADLFCAMVNRYKKLGGLDI